MKKNKVFSGIQPTGDIHLGNYLGAIKNWKKLQDIHDCKFMVMNYHALTSGENNNTVSMVKQLISLGINPDNLAIQSLIPEHTELYWILCNYCSFGELQRMTQFKDKSEGISPSLGLFNYPILQAADILLYDTDFVPVGIDQSQHLELTRNIANRFNSKNNTSVFKEPQALYTDTSKLMSLADPTKKMSKSLGDKHVINVFENKNSLHKKIKTAVTDNGDGTGIGVTNLFNILKEFDNDKYLELSEGPKQYGILKSAVYECLLVFTESCIEKLEEININQKQYIERVISNSESFRRIASEKLREVKDLISII
jgi:tryptophanyl-tRNA synthetase